MVWAIKNDSWRYEAVEIVKETAKTATYKSGFRCDTRTDLTKLFAWRGDEDNARRMVERLTSAKAEQNRRVTAARDWFAKECDKIFASGMEARQGQDAEERLDAKHDSPPGRPNPIGGSNVTRD